MLIILMEKLQNIKILIKYNKIFIKQDYNIIQKEKNIKLKN